MFGPFRITNPLSSGLLWKIPWRLSKFQKRRHRERLRAVDSVVATVDAALNKKGETLEALERWKAEMPTEAEMLPRDKYTMFDRKAKRYRKGIHSMLDLAMLANWKEMLIGERDPEVDEGQPEDQPSWFLSDDSSDVDDGNYTDELEKCRGIQCEESSKHRRLHTGDGHIGICQRRLYNICLTYGAGHGRYCRYQPSIGIVYLYYDRARGSGHLMSNSDPFAPSISRRRPFRLLL